MRIILHIGFHKTGTSALQDFLSRNAAALANQGIAYDLIGAKWRNHHPLALMFAVGADHAKGQSAAARLLHLASEKQAHTLLISSEVLIEKRTDAVSFVRCFEGHDVEVIVYVRRPDEIVTSAHDQIVRDPRHRCTRPVTDRPLAYNPRYLPALETWLNLPLKLKIAPYDRQQWPNKDLFLDFLTMIGVEDVSGFDMSASVERGNVRLVPQLNEVLRVANSHPASVGRHNQLVAMLYRLQNRFPDLLPPIPAISDEFSQSMFKLLAPNLTRLRPYFRPGFKEDFLIAPPEKK